MSRPIADDWWPTLAAIAAGGTVARDGHPERIPTDTYNDLQDLVQQVCVDPAGALEPLGLAVPETVRLIEHAGHDRIHDIDTAVAALTVGIDGSDRTILPVLSQAVEVHDATSGDLVPVLVIEYVLTGGHRDSLDHNPSLVAGVWMCLPLTTDSTSWGGHNDPGPVVHVLTVHDGPTGVELTVTADLLGLYGDLGDLDVKHDGTPAELYNLAYQLVHLGLSAALLSEHAPVSLGTHSQSAPGGLGQFLDSLEAIAGPATPPHQALSSLRAIEQGQHPLMGIMGGLLLARSLPADLEGRGWSFGTVLGAGGADRVLATHPRAGAYLIHMSGADHLMVESLAEDVSTVFLTASDSGVDHDGLATELGRYLASVEPDDSTDS